MTKALINTNLLDILVEQEKLKLDQCTKIKEDFPDLKPLHQAMELVKRGWLSQQELNLAFALQFGFKIYEVLPPPQLTKERFQQIPYAFVKKHQIIPIHESAKGLLVAVSDPLNLDALEELRFLVQLPIEAAYCSKEKIQQAIDLCYHQEEGAAKQLLANLNDKSQSENEDEIDIDDLLDTKEQAPIIKLLNLIITEAVQQGASDIHIEPFENDLRIRYRIDGVLLSRHCPPKEYHASLIARLKVMAKLDIAEHRLPQDGRIKMKMGGREIDFRVSTIPVTNGERIVLRILDKGNVVLGLDQIGMPPHLFAEFKQLITHSEGIVLVTGPTGSGKTTTLYSAICEIDAQEINIMTIEDPVEYKLPGIAQIGVQPKIKLDFATGLRHILRQDPDVILIGEIRDRETAEIAIQASLTGHLVLSTLHTNDAPSAITRLVDMDVEPYLLSSSVIGVLAQRLVRTICSHCTAPYIPTDKELEGLKLARASLPSPFLYKGSGCHHCYNSGYKGRRGIYELMSVGHVVQRQIIKSADAIELRHLALQQGMSSLREHGAELVVQGVTTVAEVLRVTK